MKMQELEGTAMAASRQWTRQADSGLISGLPLSCNGTLGTLQWEPFPYWDLSFLVCELAQKGVNLPKSLFSHQPELWVLESNRGKGMRRPMESSAGFWTLGHMSIGPFCSVYSLTIFTSPLIHPSIHLSIQQSLWPCEPQRTDIN